MNFWWGLGVGIFIGVNAGVALMCAIQINRLKHNCMEED